MKQKNNIVSIVQQTIRSHLLLSIGLLIVVTGAVIAGMLPPLILGEIVDQLTGKSQMIFQLAVIYFLLLVVSGLFDMGKEVLITIFGQKVTHRLRSCLCAKLSVLPASYYIENDAGVTVSRFVNDVDAVEVLFTSGVISMAADVCKVVSILSIIFMKSMGLGILMIAITPLLFVVTRVFQKKMLQAQIENRRAVGKVNNHIPETIKNIRMIHTFRKEAFMEKRYNDYIEEGYRSIEKSNFYDAIYSPIIVTVSSVLIAVMMVLSAKGGGVQAFFGMSVGTAVAVINYVGKVFEPLESIGMEIQNIQSAVAGIFRINEFLNEENSEFSESYPAAVQKEAAAVELEKVSFGYKKDQEILHQFSLSVQPGENITLIGRTGAGKSTVLKLLLGLYKPWEGKVRIFGMDADNIPNTQKRKIFGYVEQTFRLIPGTIKDQITLKDNTITMENVKYAMEIVHMHELVMSMEEGYGTPCTAELFSQGQMQLLSIARAIAANPAILLLDEITANLDSMTEKMVLYALQEASKNRTVISISHRLYEQSGGRKICLNEENSFK